MKNSLLRRLLATPRGAAALAVLGLLYGAALLAPFLAPYPTSEQKLSKTYHPPTAFCWVDGRPHVRIYKNIDPTAAVYVPDGDRTTPLLFFPKGHAYTLFWIIPMDRHLFGVDPAERVYLLGSDATGRDVFSRLVYGARVSMTIGLVGVSITMFLGLVIGGFAGYFGGIIDALAMRSTELLMAVPGLYLLLALRSALSERFTSDQMLLLIIVILSLIGWPGTARVVRGLCLSLRQRPFVLAAETMGQTPWKILWKHLLPNSFSYLVVSATLSVPGYILGEAALSFLGIGIQEPSSSWGLMLAQAQDLKIFMLNFWWLLSPGAAIFLTVVAFNVLGDVLRDLVDPKSNLLRPAQRP
jgi:peptide/nickel transport system permease protein